MLASFPPNFGQHWADFGRTRPNSAEDGQGLAEVWLKLANVWPKLARCWPMLATFGSEAAQPGLAELGPNLNLGCLDSFSTTIRQLFVNCSATGARRDRQGRLFGASGEDLFGNLQVIEMDLLAII